MLTLWHFGLHHNYKPHHIVRLPSTFSRRIKGRPNKTLQDDRQMMVTVELFDYKFCKSTLVKNL